MQASAQAKWAAEGVFRSDAPAEDDGAARQRGKYFGNFPYPYMNGMLHLGHAFSLSKVEFATAYHRLCGKRALFPFAFHCTGMPIKAAADKIAREMELYGCPPVFPEAPAELGEEAQAAAAAAASANAAAADPTVFKSKKSKAAAKTARAATQWEIMQLSGVPGEEIAAFADAQHWLGYFPPLGARDVAALGCGVDWRRSFITTDANPYYDSFVRWQFNKLRALGKVVRDKRFAVYSPLDGQPCADHDRASGEGVGPQEYTLIKLRVAPESVEAPGGALAPLAGRAVFLGAATLRPETMYGQTNCWVLPDGRYGAYELSAGGDVIIMTARAARNLSFQERMDCVPGAPVSLLEVEGSQLVGLALHGPLSAHSVIYALPMLTILTNKGTGIVTSVPSDAPDDFMALCDLQAKPALRAKYSVADSMVLPFAPVPTIHIPEFGDLAAPAVCAELKIKSQNERALLDEAKHRTYLKGFTEGIMLAGPHAGRPVREVKTIIRGELIAAGDALPYCEPERPVTSRSGDECVVALTDQWYLQYGETAWRERTLGALAVMDTVHPEARSQFEGTLDWLRQWACSRSFGLGTRFPWDKSYVIESLSDSTIYMAYYTVAHLIQAPGDMYGKHPGAVPAELLTDEVWEAVLLGGPAPPAAAFPPELLASMRSEFEFWYPFDLRASGKDLIQNHLTFSLYNHSAIFPERHWPQRMRCNGHLLLNGEKMSKSTGNFKTLAQAVAEYSADAVRVALADAGDGMDDANFEESTANAAILRLTRELAWFEELCSADVATTLRGADSPLTFADRVFSAELDACTTAAHAAYDALAFRDALKASFFDLQNARDAYRLLTGIDGVHTALAQRFMNLSARLLAPIAPHWAEHVWGAVLGNAGTVLTAGWPECSPPDSALLSAAAYLQETVADLRKSLAKASAPPKVKAGTAAPPPPPPLTQLDVFVSPRFTGWRATCLACLAAAYDPAANAFPPDAQLLASVKESGPGLAAEADLKQVMKQVMPFLKFKAEQARSGAGAGALQTTLSFDEAGVLTENLDYIRRSLGLQAVRIHVLESEKEIQEAPAAARAQEALPGKPASLFLSV